MIYVWIVLAVALILLAWAAWRSPFPLSILPVYLIYQFYTRFVWRLTIHGELPIVPGEGAVVISNHISPIEPAFMQRAAHKRLIHWLVAREYCEAFGVRFIMRNLGCIPTNRGGIDTAATKTVIRLAQSGELVGMLPEGRINDTDALLLPGRPGAALVALKAKVPVIPCFAKDSPYDRRRVTSIFYTFTRTQLYIGQPIDMTEYCRRYEAGDDNKALLVEVTKRFLTEIASLAGAEDFEPQIAGRRWKPGADGADDDQPAEAGSADDAPPSDAERADGTPSGTEGDGNSNGKPVRPDDPQQSATSPESKTLD